MTAKARGRQLPGEMMHDRESERSPASWRSEEFRNSEVEFVVLWWSAKGRDIEFFVSIVNMYGSFHDPRYIYLLLEYIVGGEFFTHLRKAGRFENEQSKFYASQIAAIFEYCHSKNIVYRDLKPENILINMDGYMKLSDFGFAKVIEHRTYTLCGTPEYIAPEVLLNKGHGKPVDWWTLGILIYEMIVGYPPFVDEDPMHIYQKILSGKIVFPKLFTRRPS